MIRTRTIVPKGYDPTKYPVWCRWMSIYNKTKVSMRHLPK
jgi:hypothetical protein